MENLEQSTPDVVNEAPSPSVESNSPPASAAPSAPAPEAAKEPPFHEHPRFKEIINKNNEYSQRMREYEKQVQELKSTIEKANAPASPETKLLQRLKDIDPEFGQFMEQQHATRAQLQEQLQQIEQWRSQQEAVAQRTQINSALEKLHIENKVPNELRKVYEAQLEQIARGNPNLGLQDLPSMYNEVHSTLSKYMEGVRREALASYSQSKVVSSSVPSPSKGPSPKTGTAKTEYSKDPAEARAQVVRNTLKSLRSQ